MPLGFTCKGNSSLGLPKDLAIFCLGLGGALDGSAAGVAQDQDQLAAQGRCAELEAAQDAALGDSKHEICHDTCNTKSVAESDTPSSLERLPCNQQLRNPQAMAFISGELVLFSCLRVGAGVPGVSQHEDVAGHGVEDRLLAQCKETLAAPTYGQINLRNVLYLSRLYMDVPQHFSTLGTPPGGLLLASL